MGNVTCKKCGVDYSYYTKQGFVNYNRNSCRIGTERDKLIYGNGNYKHHWEYKILCYKIY